MLETSSCGIAGLMVTDVAFVVAHVTVLNWPAVIVVGEAVRVAVVTDGGGGGGGGGGVCVVPPPPAHELKSVASRNSPISTTRTLGNLPTKNLLPILLNWKAHTKPELPLNSSLALMTTGRFKKN